MPDKLLSKQAILDAADVAYEVVDAPEWGGSVRVRSLSGLERDTYETSLFTENASGERKVNTINARARLCALTLVDDAGKRLFSEADVTELGNKNGAALDRIFDVAQRLSGIGAKAEEAARKPSPGQS